MIRFAPGDAPFLCPPERFGVFGTKISSQYQTYGPGGGFADFWTLEAEGRVTGLLLRQGRTAILCGSGDTAETAGFLRTLALDRVEGPPEFLDRLELPGEQCDASILRGESAAGTAPVSGGLIAPAASLTEVYGLLRAANPGLNMPYEGWLAENSHKVRHGLARIWVLFVDSKIISTIGIYNMDCRNALLASGATCPEGRGKGYFRQLLAYAVRQSFGRGLTPYLLAGTPELAGYYRARGFADAGRWAIRSQDKERDYI